MALSAAARLGPYEIVAPLGAGGMGEVYRARDTRLERTVAIKVLPPAVAADSEEILVRPFLATESQRWKVSATGGERPMWSRSGREIFCSQDLSQGGA